MDYTELKRFIDKEMKMTHVYQPLMLKTLLQANDQTASVEEIALAFLKNDTNQLEYYKSKVKRWPKITLEGRGVVSYKRGKGGSFRLLLDGNIGDDQRQRLIDLCDKRLQKFIDNDPGIIKNRARENNARRKYKYDVVAEARGVCVACGNGPPHTRLDIDHIIPRAKGGDDEFTNLQALCESCNRQKRARDEMDFLLERNKMKFTRKDCSICTSRPIICNKLAHAIKPEKPETKHQLWVAPSMHVHSFGDLIPAQQTLFMQVVKTAKTQIELQIRVKKFNVSFMDADLGSHCYASVTPVV